MEKRYCAAPWRGLHINFRGDVKTCCAGDPNMLGDLNTHSVDDIIHSDRMQEIRNSVKEGVLHPEYCYNCIQAERNGTSERDWHNTVNSEFDAANAGLDDYIPTLIDVRWNITCNLSCNYCGPLCSSRWAGMKKQHVNNGVKPYYLQVVDYIVKYRHRVREVALVGGEPLLLEENVALLDALHDDTLITVITNASVDLDKSSVFQSLLQRPNVGWSLSFDNTGERFEYVRHGSTFDLLDKNVNRIGAQIQFNGHHGGIHAVYNIYNCTRLRELRQYADSKQLKILWQTLYQPEYLDPARHNQPLRDIALREIELFEQEYGPEDFFEHAKIGLQNIASDSSVRNDFWQHIEDIENRYHQDQRGGFARLWPELFMLI
jgi:organic radical activating enzyme